MSKTLEIIYLVCSIDAVGSEHPLVAYESENEAKKDLAERQPDALINFNITSVPFYTEVGSNE